MKIGYAWMVKFADGWDWLDETIYTTIDEVYEAAKKKGFPRKVICTDKVQVSDYGDVDVIQHIWTGGATAYWDDDLGWIAGQRATPSFY